MTSLLRLSNLRKSIAGHRLFEIPEFDIPTGAGIVLIGRNGAGKSTLLKILAGLEPPDWADVTYQGRTTGWQAAKPLLQCDVIYLHQHPYMFDRSVAETSPTACGGPAFRARRSGPRWKRPWNGRDSASSPSAMPAACPAAKNNGSGSPGHGYSRPICCCWTSRWPIWTTPPGTGPSC